MKKIAVVGTAVAVWVATTVVAMTLPPEYIRTYATLWAGAVMLLSLVLTVAFIALSKPTRDPVTGKREWLVEWWWVLMMISGFLIVFLQAFVLRLIVPWVPEPTYQQVIQQRFSAAAYATAFLMQFTTSIVWARQQIRTRRSAKEM